MTNEMTCTNASRGGLHEAIARARYGGERTLLTVRGEPAAVVVPLVDLVRLEQPAEAKPPQQEET